MALRTRRPTGQVAWPLILVEGAEKTGKSYAAYRLSADERVGRTFVVDLGEGTADEYARLGPYEVIEHNGTFADVLEQIRDACAEPTKPGVPNVVVIDSVTALWDLLKDWTDGRARNSKKNRELLKADPDAEIDPTMNLWNDAKDRWYQVINTLRRADVVGVLIARGKEVAKVKGGQPVAGQTDYKVEAEKTTPFAVSVQVRMTKPHAASLVAVRSLDVEVPANGVALPDENPLAHLVFDLLKAGEDSGPAQVTFGVVGLDVGRAKRNLVDFLTGKGLTEDTAKAEAKKLWDTHFDADVPEVTPDQMARVIGAAAEWVATKGTTAAEPDPAQAELDGKKAKAAANEAYEAQHPKQEPKPRLLTTGEAVELIRSRAFTVDNPESQDHGRTLIHTRASGIGADWDLEAAVEYANTANRIEWASSIFGHALSVTGDDDRTVFFNVPAPKEAE